MIRQAAGLASVALTFDNSKRGQPPRWLLTLQQGRLIEKTDADIPRWATELYFQTRR